MDNEKKNALTAEADGLIEGRNAVIEALKTLDFVIFSLYNII